MSEKTEELKQLLGGKLILFVDDDYSSIGLEVISLKEVGISVHVRTNLDDAVKFVNEQCQSIGLVVIDLHLDSRVPHGELLGSLDVLRSDGLNTGQVFYSWLVKKYENIPCFIYTRVRNIYQDKPGSTEPIIISKSGITTIDEFFAVVLKNLQREEETLANGKQ